MVQDKDISEHVEFCCLFHVGIAVMYFCERDGEYIFMVFIECFGYYNRAVSCPSWATV